jgi:hypothetical protein
VASKLTKRVTVIFEVETDGMLELLSIARGGEQKNAIVNEAVRLYLTEHKEEIAKAIKETMGYLNGIPDP